MSAVVPWLHAPRTDEVHAHPACKLPSFRRADLPREFLGLSAITVCRQRGCPRAGLHITLQGYLVRMAAAVSETGIADDSD